MTPFDFVKAYSDTVLSRTIDEYLDAVSLQFQSKKQYWEEESGKSWLPKIFAKKPKCYKYSQPSYLYAVTDAPFLRNNHSSLLSLGYYLALTKQDMSRFQSAIYQHVRLDSLDRLDSGCDHALFAVYAIRALSAGDADLFQKFLPEQIGEAKQGHPANIAIVNIAMGLWYKNEEILTKGLALARKRQTLKSETALVKTVLRYMTALSENNANDMSDALDELCQNVNRDKEGWLRCEGHPLAEYIVLFAHGLYQLASLVVDNDEFKKIVYPSVRFDRIYAQWLTGAVKPSEPLVRFNGELSLLNHLIELIPETRLISEGRDIYYDTKAFIKELLAGLATQGIDLEAHFRKYNN